MSKVSLLLGFTFISIALSDRTMANYVINGGFETGDFSGWTLLGDPTSNFVDSGFPHGGVYNAAFGETGDLGSLSQTLTTTVGTSYTLSFWFAGNNDVPSEFTASVGGKLLLDLVNPTSDGSYHQYTYNFVATTASTPLQFGFRDDSYFIYLDDVSVTTAAIAPEPTSLILLGLGLMSVTGYTLYRRKLSL